MDNSNTTSSGSNSKRFIVACVAVTVAVIIGIGGIVYAATPLPKGSILVTTYDVTGGIKERLGNVVVQVNSVGAPYECDDPTRQTAPASAGPSVHGTTKFVGCEAGVYSKPNRKYLKYTVIRAERAGYQMSQKSKFKAGVNKQSSRGGSFAVRRNQTTRVELSLEREGSLQPARALPNPTPPSGGTGGLPTSPNANTNTPCGTAFVPVINPLIPANVITQVSNPSGCLNKESAHVS